MKQELERLRALITQLATRLQGERDARIQLANQLAAREGELRRSREQIQEMKRKIDAMLTQFGDTGSGR
ncbi:hypothetical protein [Sutterella sp.]|uniref:hypothetical protein n=1 Tax=Sutterella sp. TaxID=1981025 RepID=UPI0026E001F0|nr:hypothetical protein [Sutterella sp.]MDO5532525.1 hypothetical protein [Sutterella sp.]